MNIRNFMLSMAFFTIVMSIIIGIQNFVFYMIYIMEFMCFIELVMIYDAKGEKENE